MRLKDASNLSKLCRSMFWACTAAFGALLLAASPAVAGLSGPIEDVCLPDFTACSSNDLTVLDIVAVGAGGNPTCNPDEGDNDIDLEISTTIVVQSGGADPEAQIRYDLGFYVVVDGIGNVCGIDILEEGNFTGGAIDTDGDNCREVSTTPVTHTNTFVGIPCTDEVAPFGSVDPFTICQSWGNNEDQITDCTVETVDTGTNPKCLCTLFDPGITFPVCGNGIPFDTKGEQCDDGNQIDNDFCDNECQLPVCGDGVLEGDEECDLGPSGEGDGQCCDPKTCQFIGLCGNGVEECAEECDDGNQDNTDFCTTSCLDAFCGDGFTHAGVEECDDGNGIDNDFCDNACQLPICGNGEVEGSEACDDGKLNGTPESTCGVDCNEVPTMGEYGLGALALLLIGAGFVAVRKGNLI